jgi:CP family cyanate transporter-like MFS transporter
MFWRRDDSGGTEPNREVSAELSELGGRKKALVGLGIVAVALNLRPGVTSFGSVLGQFSDAWRLPGAGSGVLTALPVATFAGVGLLAPTLARRFGAEPVIAAAMLTSGLGLLLRANAQSMAAFFACSFVALAGAAIGNVLLPPLVKRYFPDQIGPMTALYSTALAIGMTSGAALTIPAEQAFGLPGEPAFNQDWRVGLGVWADLAALAALPWLAVCWFYPGPTHRSGDTGPAVRSPIYRSATARWLTLYFGCQSCNAYVVLGWLPSILTGAGLEPRAASLSLAVAGAMSIPVSLLIPPLAARRPSQYRLVWLTTLLYAGGYLGLLWAPGPGHWVWAILLGAANGSLPLAVTMISLRSGRPELTAALSAMTQSGGYLLAIAGPVLVGLLHQATGGWRIPLFTVLVTLTVQLVSGLRAATPRTVDAELHPARP